MENVSIIYGTESKEIEDETNKKIFELKEKGCQILNVNMAGRSNSYRKDWTTLSYMMTISRNYEKILNCSAFYNFRIKILLEQIFDSKYVKRYCSLACCGKK